MNLLIGVSLIGALSIITPSCKKDSTSGTTTTVSPDDAADAITEAIVPESAGMVAQTQTATVIIITGNYDCGIEKDTAFSGANVSGAAVTYNYAFRSTRLLSCNNGIPASFAYTASGSSSYDAPRVSSADSTSAQFSVTGLQPSASQYVFTQTYIRNGSENSKVRNKIGFTSNITIKTTNLTVDKNSGLILSGAASVSISGSATNGKSFSYSGTLTFSGNKQATLDLGNGNTYTISWS